MKAYEENYLESLIEKFHVKNISLLTTAINDFLSDNTYQIKANIKSRLEDFEYQEQAQQLLKELTSAKLSVADLKVKSGHGNFNFFFEIRVNDRDLQNFIIHHSIKCNYIFHETRYNNVSIKLTVDNVDIIYRGEYETADLENTLTTQLNQFLKNQLKRNVQKLELNHKQIIFKQTINRTIHNLLNNNAELSKTCQSEVLSAKKLNKVQLIITIGLIANEFTTSLGQLSEHADIDVRNYELNPDILIPTNIKLKTQLFVNTETGAIKNVRFSKEEVEVIPTKALRLMEATKRVAIVRSIKTYVADQFSYLVSDAFYSKSRPFNYLANE